MQKHVPLGSSSCLVMSVLLVSLGVFVHCVYLMSIFDMYFRSPVVHGMTPHAVPLEPPAKRLVVISADGVRADKFFGMQSNGETLTPFLRQILTTRGSWGVSHTRVPTETRPCHVALIAGFYEDVSAVTKGWKENPVNFDSILNESRRAWCWGSPEVLSIFNPPDSTGLRHVTNFMYPWEFNDFAQADAAVLDLWVFDRFKEFFQNALQDKDLIEELHQNRVVFFLHLMGADTNGHIYKPFSDSYLRTIQMADHGIKQVVGIINDFFQDNLTSYVVTSDHGMTDWGSHGAGDKHETLTPLVAWGAGIAGPETEHEKQFMSIVSPESWEVNGLLRKDVSQADLVPLMATLIGIPIPMNSVGVLPLSYLNVSSAFKAHSMVTNAKQIMEQFSVKESKVKGSTLEFLYRPYEPLRPSKRMLGMREIDDAIRLGNYSEAVYKARVLIKTATEGLRYYEKYDRFFVGSTVVIGFVGWILCIAIQIFKYNRDAVFLSSARSNLPSSYLITYMCCSAALMIVITLFSLSSPLTYYLYCLLPLLFWPYILKHHSLFLFAINQFQWRRQYVEFMLTAFVAVTMIEIFVFSFFWRSFLFAGCIILSIWPLTLTSTYTKKGLHVVLGWIVFCLAVGVFPLFHLPGPEHSILLMAVSSIVSLLLVLYCLFRQELGLFGQQQVLSNRERKWSIMLLVFQLFLMLLSIYIAISSVISRNRKLGLSSFNQTLSWIILALSFFLPSLGSKFVLLRLLHIALAFLPSYILLSMEYETFFYASLCVLLFFWLQMERRVAEYDDMPLKLFQFGHRISQKSDSYSEKQAERTMTLSDIRIAVFFLFFILTAFFGTGNIASINTFNPSSIHCFVSVFSPFIMGGLLIWKIAMPFILVCSTLSAVQMTLRIPLRQLFLAILLMSDIMALHFFFMVQDYGTWKQIGMSIGHFVIMITMTVAILLMFVLAQVLTGSVNVFEKPSFKKLL